MKEDDLRIEDDPEILYDALLKVDLIEGQLGYIMFTGYTHNIQTKTNFIFGCIDLYIELKKVVTLFKGDILSSTSLNQEINWDNQYFEKIRASLETGGKDFKYSFKPTDDENPSDLDYTLKVTERITFPGSKKQISSEVSILKVKLRLNPQTSFLDSLFSTFFEQNQRKKLKLTVLAENVTKLDKQRQELVNELERTIQIHKRSEADLQNKCVFLLNKKKNKIRELQQAREITQQQQIDDIANVMNEPKKASSQALVQITKQEPTNQQRPIRTNNQFNGLSQDLMSQPQQLGSLFEQTLVDEVKKEKEDSNFIIDLKEKVEENLENQNEVEHVQFDEDYFMIPRKKIK